MSATEHDGLAEPPGPEADAWRRLVDAMRAAGEQVLTDTAGLSRIEQADGLRALLRAFANQLGRFEVDRDKPELIPFNGWRQKFLMDNPDFATGLPTSAPTGGTGFAATVAMPPMSRSRCTPLPSVPMPRPRRG
ncbi:hypothetical protein [Mycolicibacter senuensis]|uniref:Uncharacterized protein n=1 Tax=Mycolicibacter senuensis TaxID=386913 RepID=A0A7I9XHS5_9MYCO|nr:hypothetical protein [Mycolicibacter senuensis]GFG69515.1 hypothetical protein MSEN_12350 [Mycolicibacter senuensis]